MQKLCVSQINDNIQLITQSRVCTMFLKDEEKKYEFNGIVSSQEIQITIRIYE